jgi:hypothetical protein
MSIWEHTLAGKVALVTGGRRVIGKTIVNPGACTRIGPLRCTGSLFIDLFLFFLVLSALSSIAWSLRN